jgi:hypothetical protein
MEAAMTPVVSTQRSFARFDAAAQRVLGVDMRLLYGMGVPVVGTCVLVALAFGFAASTWAVVVMMAVEVIMLGIVLCGFSILLRDTRDDEPDV